MDKKYELTDETKELYGHTLHRIKALRDFGEVKKGDIGGWVESENNLSQSASCWVFDNGRISDNGYVSDNGHVSDNGYVFGNGHVSDNGYVCGNGLLSGNGRISGNGCVSGDGHVFGNGHVSDNGHVSGNGHVCGGGWVFDNGHVSGNGEVSGNAKIAGDGLVKSDEDYAVIQGFGTEQRTTTFFRCSDGLVRTQCGCFYGTIDEFREQVKDTRDGQIAKDYLAIADLMEDHFSK